MQSIQITPLEPRQLFAAAPAIPQFVETDLVSDGAVAAAHVDASLVNGWGLAFNKQGVVWVANNGTGTSTVYDTTGATAGPVVTIPPAAGGVDNAAVTGVVFNTAGKKAFNITSGGTTVPAEYVFVSEQGTISAWDPAVGNAAVNVVDNSASGAIYKGVAIVGKGKKAFLVVANFHSGQLEAYDSNFQPVTLPPGTLNSSTTPSGFAPFNVQTLGGKIYVTYALQDANAEDEIAGVGNGAVSVFNARGKFLNNLAIGGTLNAPWAVVQGSGKYKGDILVGNFGDGTISVFKKNGTPIGQAQNSSGQTLAIPGLWGMAYGTGANKKTLFFAAGPNDEGNGLFGSLTLNQPTKASSSSGGGGFHY
jgi:uncharacterized protein (TIGR03118 family)